MADLLPAPAPGGLCTSCRQSLYFDRDRRALWCRACKLWFRWLDEEPWTPGAKRK